MRAFLNGCGHSSLPALGVAGEAGKAKPDQAKPSQAKPQAPERGPSSRTSTPHGQAALRSRPPRLARNLQVDNWPELRPNTLDALQQFVERGVDLLHEPIKAFAANEFDLTWLMR